MPRRKTPTPNASVWDAVPAVAHAEKLLTETQERLSALPLSPLPEEARQEVIDAAVRALRTDGTPIPTDIGDVAAQAFTAALAPYSERLALTTAEHSLRRRIPFLKSQGATTVLEALAVRLDDVMTEVRAIVERSGHLDGDTAIEAGDQGITDYRRLRELVGAVDEIRRVQRSVYAEIGDVGVLSSFYRAGHDEFRNVRREPLPADIVAVVEGQRRRGVPFLIFMAESGRAWLATSLEALEDEAADVDNADEPAEYWQHSATVTAPSSPRPTRF
jgi:hypothetical protein